VKAARTKKRKKKQKGPYMYAAVYKWYRTVLATAKLFKHGQARIQYADALKKGGFQRTGAIMKPSTTRMVVHCVKFVRQSLRHWAVRLAAVRSQKAKHLATIAAATSATGAQGRPDLLKHIPNLEALEVRLADPSSYFMAAVKVDSLACRGGYTEMLTTAQSASMPFFPRYMALRRGILILQMQIGDKPDLDEYDEIFLHLMPMMSLVPWYNDTLNLKRPNRPPVKPLSENKWCYYRRHASILGDYGNRATLFARLFRMCCVVGTCATEKDIKCVLLGLLPRLLPRRLRDAMPFTAIALPVFIALGNIRGGVVSLTPSHLSSFNARAHSARVGMGEARLFLKSLAAETAAAFFPRFGTTEEGVPADLAAHATLAWWWPTMLLENVGLHPEWRCDAFMGCLRYLRKKFQGSLSFPSNEVCCSAYTVMVDDWRLLFQCPSRRQIVFETYHGGMHFDWRSFWQIVHVESGMVVPNTWYAFFAFHASGMLGTSEAMAEGAASALKRFSDHRLACSTGRTVQKARLYLHGIRGLGNDDFFILKCWSLFFGSSNFNFWCRNEDQRMKRWPLGSPH